MSTHEKLRARMRNNPREWRIEDLKAVADCFGIVWRNYSAPCDYIPRRSYPLCRAREVLAYLFAPGAAEVLAIPTPP